MINLSDRRLRDAALCSRETLSSLQHGIIDLSDNQRELLKTVSKLESQILAILDVLDVCSSEALEGPQKGF